MESLGLDLSKIPIDFLLNILNIVLLFVIVRSLAYKPIRKFMDARTARVAAEAAKAEEEAAEAQKIKAEYEEKLQNSAAECAAQIQAAHRQAQAEADEIRAKAQKEAQEILDDARARAKHEHDETLGTMQQDVVDLAFGISEKLLEHSITDADTKRMADRLFDERVGGGKAS